MDALTVSERYVPEKAALNADVLGRMRTYTAMISGATAGMLGLTGVAGFVFFVAMGFLAGVIAIATTCPDADAGAAFINGRGDVLSLSGLLAPALTYILVWMVVYDCLYVF